MSLQTTIASKVHECYWKENLNCAITTLQILSENFALPLHPQIIQGTLGLNAGRFASQCGLVQGSLLFVGIYGHHHGMEQTEITSLCHQFSNEFKQQFTSLLCNYLRPQGFSPEQPPHLCENLTVLAITFATEFIQREIHHDLQRK